MAVVTITLTDEAEGRVGVDAESSPPFSSIPLENTPAQEMATMLLEAARDVFEKWTG